MRFAFISKHRHVWPLEWMCSALEVSRSGFHAWLTRALSARALADAALTPVIERSFKASDRTYGARRVWHDVLAEGRVYRSRDEARADVFDYIERFYNPKRRHSTLGYLSPVEFEKRAVQA